MRLPALILTIATLSGFAICSQAQTVELVTNGGFETGDFTGWDHTAIFAGPGPGFFYGINVGSGGHSGTACINIFGDTAGSVTQTLTTTPGMSYQISLWATGGDGGGGTFDGGASGLIFAKIDGNDVISASNQQMDNAFHIWKQFDSSFTATSASTTLVVGAKNTYWNYLIDDISVTSVPEPSTYGLVAGVTILGFVLWRKVGREA